MYNVLNVTKLKAGPFLLVLALSILVPGLTIACGLSSRLVEQVQAAPTPVITNGLIAYTDIDGNIYTIDHKGENRKALTQDASLSPGQGETFRQYMYPTWAPDGIHLAFIEFSLSQESGPHSRLLSVNTVNLESIETFASDEFFPFYLYWSPDSQKISFLGNATTQGDLALHLAFTDASQNQVVDMGQPYYWDWSPDGKEIISHTGGSIESDPEAKLAFIAMQDPYLSQNLDLHPSFFQAPDWSPAGDAIALSVQTENKGTLMLLEKSGGERHTIAEFDGPVTFAFSPDGKQLAYSVNSEARADQGYQDLYVVQLSQPEEKKLLTTNIILGFFWSPDSDYMALFTPSDAGSGIELTGFMQQGPHGIKFDLGVIDLVNSESRHLIAFTPTESFLNIFPFYDQYQRSITIWSPDSREIVIAGSENQENPGIYVINALEGGYARIATGELAFWSWK
jgi:Tol biopolymer transport system component